MLIQNVVSKFSVRSLIVLTLVGGSLFLAIVDKEFRPVFGRLADIGLGGYLGQLVPRHFQQKEEAEDSKSIE